MRILTLAIGALAIASAASAAGSALSITRSVFVETRSDGGLALEPATTLASGDKVVLVMQWSRPGAQHNSGACPLGVVQAPAQLHGAGINMDQDGLRLPRQQIMSVCCGNGDKFIRTGDQLRN